ncbi:MAG: ATP-binding protein [Pseudomonadota bacterium]
MKKKIIAIDDEALILDAFKAILEKPRISSDMDYLASLTESLPLSGPGQAPSDPGLEYYEVHTALQGEDGFNRIREAREAGSPFHLAFIDVRMPPGWDGIQTAKAIRKLDPFIEIVIVTAYSDKKHSEIVREVGTPDKLLYLRKPFDAEEIRQIALSLTRKWELELKHRKHLGYLEQLLNSVRRIKTLGISSVKDVLLAILNELLTIVNADKGIVFSVDKGHSRVEIFSETMTHDQVTSLVTKVVGKAESIHEITSLEDALVFPIKNEAGNYLILVCSKVPIIDEEKLNLLKLFIETASEVLLSVNQQEQFLKNEKVATIGQVAAGIIHEINNPLSSLVSLIQPNGLMKKKLSSIDRAGGDNERLVGEITRYLDIASMATHHISSIVSSMRGMTGANKAMFKVQDITIAIEDALILAQNTLRKSGIQVHRDWTSPLMASCDLNGLKQVFLNLILNAAQAMERKGELWIRALNQEGRIQVSIRDSGPGIPKAIQDQIFKLFYTTKEDGTGLGLSIVKGIVDNHHGSIRIESEPGQGAVFYIDFAAV